MITLYGRLNSSNVQKASWTLAELGLAFRNIPLGGSFGGLDDPAYRALNPHGLVPTLVDGDVTVWDSDAIVAYLGARYGAAAFWPLDPAARASADQWVFWAKTVFDPIVMDLFWRTARLPKAEQGREDLSAEIAQLATATATLEAGLAAAEAGRRAWLTGASFGYGEIALGMLAHRYALLPVEKPDTPAFDRWRARFGDRPAYRRWVAMPFGTCYEDWIAFERTLG